ncbi:ankyrin repeat domain-containing protein 26-like isoform X3 [Cololabis saira]|uniref:ankyrin repeat domain-containing protein 26-like isoform X3 n=1 Tax=Cololabis saira TaxID=129043 RepID=UPI002AD54DBA|nr:ankyrin repeat domain-containing protein 26-like isoform X3 [Cololabis saira]
MKKIFSFTKKKKHPFGTPDNGSVLSAGYDLKEKDLSKVHKAAYQGDLAKLKQLAKKNDINQVDKENRAPLHIACANGHAEVVQFLVGSRANLNLCDNQNRSALMKAVQGQHEHCVSILLENDAQPNLLDVNGNTALHLAVNIPSVSTAVLLLQHGAEINAQNKEGFTPLTVAVREDHIEMAEFLLKKEAEINCVDRDQRSPLMLAAGNGQISMVKLLLHFKADIKLKDTKGWSADDYAVMNEHHPCSLLIIDHGTQRTDGASGSHQSQNKKKKMLGSPSHDVEAGFALGGPAADKEEHGANEAGGDFEDNSQSESLSRVSKSAADEWLTSEDEDESASFEKKPLKVNLSKMIGSKKGKAENSPERKTRKLSEQHPGSNKGSDSQEGSSAGEEEEEEDEDEEEEEEDEEDEEEDEEEEDEDDDEEDEEEDDDDDDEEEEEESYEKEENEDEEEDDSAGAAVQADMTEFEDTQKPSVTVEIYDRPGTVCHNAGTPVEAEADTENADLSCSAGTAAYAVATSLSGADDCVVSAIRVESKFSDEDESLEKESLMSSDKKIILGQGLSESPRHCTEPLSGGEAKADDSGRQKEKDEADDDSWNDTENSGDKTWNDSDKEEGKTGLSCSALIALQRNVLAKVETENAESQSDEDAESKAVKGEKHLSSWGSSPEGSDIDMPKKSEGNVIVQQKIEVQVQDLEPNETKIAPSPDHDQPNTTWDSSSASIKCVSPKMVIEESKSFAGLSSVSSPKSKSKPCVDSVKESEWDSSENDRNAISPVINSDVMSPDSKPNVLTPNQTAEKQECSWEEEDKDFGEESNDPSPMVSSAPEDEDASRNQRLDDDDDDDAESVARETQMERKTDSDTENEDNSWDEEDESDDPEKQMTMKAELQSSPVHLPSQQSGTTNATGKKFVTKQDNVVTDYSNEVDSHSFIDEEDELVEDSKAEHETLAVDRKSSLRKDESEDSDSEHQKLLYDFVSTTVTKLDERDDTGDAVDECLREDKTADENEPRLTSYLPLEDAAENRQVSHDLNKGPTRENTFSSPPTRDYTSGGEGVLGGDASEPLPQTDIDDVGVDSSDEAEDTGMGEHELRDMEETDLQTDDSTEDEDNQEDEGQVEEGDISEENDKPGDGGESPASSRVPEAEAVRNNKRDFLSELGLEEGEEDQDSRGSESHSENSNQLHEEKEGLHTHSQELPTREQKPKENLFYVPSFLRGKGGVGMAELEPHRRVGRPKSSQGEGNSDNDDNQDGIVEEDETTQKDNGKAKWQPLNVLSKLEKDFDQKTDLMEDLGLGDVDDLEDASDWDSASTTSKRTLPGRRLASPGLEEFPECSNLSANEEEEDAALVAPPTPQRNISSDNKPPSTPSKSAPQPHPRARTLVIQKPESEEDSDWEPEMTSSCKASPADNQLQTRAEPSSVVKPGSPEPNLMTKDSKSSSPFDKHQQELGEETARASVEVENPSVSWDSAGATLEEVNCEKPEPGLRCPSSPAGVHQEQHPVAARSANRAPVQLHLPVQQACNGKKQEKQAVEESSKPELVRGARHSRAPQTNTHVNGDPPSVFDDSSLSDMSDAEGRLQTSEQQRTKNPEDMGLAEDFDELTQSSDTATDDTDSPTSGYRHASLLIQKLDMATLDSTTIAKLQNIFHEYERSIQKARSSHGNVTDKVNQLEMERAGLKISLEESRDDKSALERSQLELKTEVTNLKFQLKNEQENRRNATMLYNTNRDKLRSMEELHQRLVQERKTLELEMRTLISNMKRLEGDHSEAQRLLAQERSARTLQENLLNTHIRKQQEIEEESKRNESKSNEALSQLTEASDRERELLQQSATLQEQLFMAKKDLERLRANSSLKENHLLEENETLKEHVEDVRRDLKLSNEAVTQTVFNCNNQLTTLKAELTLTTTRLESERHTRESLETEVELTRSQLAGALKEAELSQTAHADAEKALLREKEEQQRLKDRLTGDTATSREAVSSLSQKLAKAESDANRVENDLHRVTLQLTEKSLLLDVLQREKDQASSRAKELETALQAEKESVGRAKARQEASQERLAQAQSETMLLRQQLEEAANKGVAKERAVTDAQERFSDIVSKLRSDSEERVQLVEERNKELASKAADLRDDIYKLEEEKNERETKLRHLQQELADSLKKLSMSEASLEVNTCYRNDLEKEKTRLLKDLDRLKGKLEESEDQYVQAERRINGLKGSLDERNQEVAIAAQKLQGALSASAAADITIKQLEEAVQKLEIENARLEAGTKQQSNKIDALQKEAQEAAMLTDCSSGGGVRGRLEDLVTNLQGSKMTLEDQLNREVQKQSNLSHTAQDSQALWEEELKSRSKLGLRLAELEKEKGELTSQMEIEKKKAKKSTEQKKAIDIRLDQEMKRNTELQKEMYRQRTLLKTAKKKLRDQEAAGAEFGSPSNSLRLDLSRHSQADGAVGRMKDKVDDLQVQLEKEAYRCSQLEKLNGDLKDQVVSLRSSSHSSEQLERSKRLLEDEVLDLRRRMETAQLEQSQVEQYRREAEERVRQEIQQKLQEVNLFLQSQAASQEALDQIKAVNDAKLRSQLEQKIRELEGEVGRARSTQQDSLNQRESTRSELERYQQLYKEELRLRKSLAAKLERANGRLADANSKLLSERSRSFLTSNVTNGSLVGPSLDLSSLGSPAHYGAPLGPLNRSLNLGFSLLSPVTERPNKGVEDYLAKVQSELDRNISEELRNATAELDAAPARMSPVGSVDPLSRATQQYLEVLKKNNRL